jgi:hypothetical protein
VTRSLKPSMFMPSFCSSAWLGGAGGIPESFPGRLGGRGTGGGVHVRHGECQRDDDAYCVRGGNGPAMILLHGFPHDWSVVRRVMPRACPDCSSDPTDSVNGTDRLRQGYLHVGEDNGCDIPERNAGVPARACRAAEA